jgi:hypothetical protein
MGYPAESGGSTDVVQTADKYDFLMVFRDPEEMSKTTDDATGEQSIFSPLTDLVSGALATFNEAEINDDEQMSCRRARTLWRLSTPGPDTVKDKAEVYFNNAWKAKFHNPLDEVSGAAMNKESVPFFAVRTLFREMICDTLSQSSGLQLKLSRSNGNDNGLIMCRVRAPVAVLEQEADRIDHRLQFRDEVDPGAKFWFQGKHNEEIRNEASDIDRADAEKRLRELYDNQKISANDMAIFDDEPRENIALWSRRVHTLERIADMVPCSNSFPPYAPFSLDPKRRHLFRQHQSVRGKILFTSKDRLALTASIIQQTLSTSTLMKHGLLIDVLPLHDANLGEVLSNEVLTKRWVYPWKDSRRKIGAPTVSSSYMSKGKSVPLLLYLFSQPLNDVRDYFGEKVAFYFAFIGFFTFHLVLPAILGLGVQIYLIITGYTWCEDEIDWFWVAAAAALVMWCTVVAEMWKGESAIAATTWGTDDSGSVREPIRSEFVAQTIGGPGAEEWTICGMRSPFGFMEGLYYEVSSAMGYQSPKTTEDYRRNVVTNRFEPYYPGWLRSFWVSVSLFIVLVCIGAIVAGVQAFMMLENYLQTSVGLGIWAEYIVSIIIALIIPAVCSLMNKLSVNLNDNENHKTQDEYDGHLVVKVFILNVVTYFAPLCYLAFIKESTYGCANDCCMDETSIQFCSILFVTLALKLAGPLARVLKIESRIIRCTAWTSKKFFRCLVFTINCFAGCSRGYFGYLPSDYFVAVDPNAGMAKVGDNAQPWEQEYDREPYEGVFDDMVETLLLLCLVTSFFSIFPSAPLFLVITNLLEIRMDAHKMMTKVRRPLPESASGMGLWVDLMDLVSIIAALSNSAIVVFTTNSFASYSVVNRYLVWLVTVTVMLIIRSFLVWYIPAEPFGLSDVRKRHKFLRLKHVFGFMEDDDDDDGSDALRVRGVVDLESMDLSKMVGGAENAEVVEQIRNYQTQLRLVNNELEEQKEALQEAMQYEIMNNKTGIGETLDGLPLGCLYVTLEKIENFTPEPLPFAGNIQMVISLRSNDASGDRTAPGPPPVTSKRGRPTRTKGEIDFEELFTMAPIKSHKADVFFDIMDSSTDPKRRGTAFLPLSKLEDQMVHQKAIFISQRDPDNATRFNPSEAMLKVKVQFKYSKIKPIKERIAALTKSQASIEKEITMARLGKERSDVA